jgi:hypothetical protein
LAVELEISIPAASAARANSLEYRISFSFPEVL